jgi:phage-related protein
MVGIDVTALLAQTSCVHSGYAILKSVTWNVTFFNKRVEADILALPTDLLARFLRYAERMEVFGPDLGMPHTRAMGGGLFELRIKASEGIARVFYCTVVDRRIVFLHHFVKKTKKTPPKEIDIARKRMKELRHG